MTEKYISVSLPSFLVKKIDKIVGNKELGYSSRPEFIKDAIRRHIEHLGFDFELNQD